MWHERPRPWIRNMSVAPMLRRTGMRLDDAFASHPLDGVAHEIRTFFET
jgi:hypothetical protein